MSIRSYFNNLSTYDILYTLHVRILWQILLEYSYITPKTRVNKQTKLIKQLMYAQPILLTMVAVAMWAGWAAVGHAVSWVQPLLLLEFPSCGCTWVGRLGQDKGTGWGSSIYISTLSNTTPHTSSLSLTFQCQSSSSSPPCAAGRAECVPQRQGRCTPAWWAESSSRTAWGSHRWQSTWQAPWCPTSTRTRWDGQSTQTGLPLHPSLNGNGNGICIWNMDSEWKQAWDGCKGYCVSSRLQQSIFSSLNLMKCH